MTESGIASSLISVRGLPSGATIIQKTKESCCDNGVAEIPCLFLKKTEAIPIPRFHYCEVSHLTIFSLIYIPAYIYI